MTLKQFPVDVLQLKLGEWCPEDQGVDRIAVLPGQLFRAWVGPDESKFSQEQVTKLRGQLGTLVFLIDGAALNIDL